MRLKFEPGEFDFALVGPEPEETLEELSSGEIGLHIDVLINEKGEIGYLYWPFLNNPLRELEIEILYFRRAEIPGRYDVPELGLKNATFIEVLEAVQRYFTARFFPRKLKQNSRKD